MIEDHDPDFEGIMQGLREARAHAEGTADLKAYRVTPPNAVDVKAIRSAMKLTQAAFAARFGLPRATVEDWEQGRRQPELGSRILLKVIEREPEAVDRALAAR